MALLRYTWVVLLLAGVTSALTGIRLRGGKHQHEGRVEIEHDGQWKAVCDHGWNKYAARVVCRMLGFPDMLRYTKGLVAQLFFPKLSAGLLLLKSCKEIGRASCRERV